MGGFQEGDLNAAFAKLAAEVEKSAGNLGDAEAVEQFRFLILEQAFGFSGQFLPYPLLSPTTPESFQNICGSTHLS